MRDINKKICIVLSLILLLLLFTTAVSASDNETVIEKSDETINQLEINEHTESSNVKNDNYWNLTTCESQSTDYEDLLNTNENNNVLTANHTVSGNTFQDITKTIENANDGDIIFLNGGAYTGNGNSIHINKNLTIYGGSSITDTKMATLNAQKLSRILDITKPSSVTLIGINFINGIVNSYGGAIYCTAENCNVYKCNFINNTANNGYGGAIYWTGVNGTLSDCNFIINTNYGYGGAFYCTAENCTVSKCNFINNIAHNGGGAILWVASTGTVSECNFLNNIANFNQGGAIYWTSGENCTVSKCNFINNIAYNGGGAIYLKFANNVTVSECNFMYNTANNGYGGAIYCGNDNSQVINCAFTDNTPNNVEGIKNKPSYIIIMNNTNPIVGDTVEIKIIVKSLNSYNVTINNQEQTVVDNIVKYQFNKAENYKIIVSNSQDDTNLAVNETITLTVKLPTKITASSVTTVYNVNKNLVISVKDNNGNPVNGVKVTVILNSAKTYTTDKNGQIKVSTYGLAPKRHTVTITFAGDDNYAKSSTTAKITVNKATPKITAKAKTFKKSVKTKKYSITLKNDLNKVMKNTQVTIKVNTKTYTAKTNSKGIATFKITKLTKKGTFKSVITYKGNKYYNKVTKTVKIKVK